MSGVADQPFEHSGLFCPCEARTSNAEPSVEPQPANICHDEQHSLYINNNLCNIFSKINGLENKLRNFESQLRGNRQARRLSSNQKHDNTELYNTSPGEQRTTLLAPPDGRRNPSQSHSRNLYDQNEPCQMNTADLNNELIEMLKKVNSIENKLRQVRAQVQTHGQQGRSSGSKNSPKKCRNFELVGVRDSAQSLVTLTCTFKQDLLCRTARANTVGSDDAPQFQNKISFLESQLADLMCELDQLNEVRNKEEPYVQEIYRSSTSQNTPFNSHKPKKCYSTRLRKKSINLPGKINPKNTFSYRHNDSIEELHPRKTCPSNYCEICGWKDACSRISNTSDNISERRKAKRCSHEKTYSSSYKESTTPIRRRSYVMKVKHKPRNRFRSEDRSRTITDSESPCLNRNFNLSNHRKSTLSEPRSSSSLNTYYSVNFPTQRKNKNYKFKLRHKNGDYIKNERYNNNFGEKRNESTNNKKYKNSNKNEAQWTKGDLSKKYRHNNNGSMETDYIVYHILPRIVKRSYTPDQTKKKRKGRQQARKEYQALNDQTKPITGGPAKSSPNKTRYRKSGNQRQQPRISLAAKGHQGNGKTAAERSEPPTKPQKGKTNKRNKLKPASHPEIPDYEFPQNNEDIKDSDEDSMYEDIGDFYEEENDYKDETMESSKIELLGKAPRQETEQRENLSEEYNFPQSRNRKKKKYNRVRNHDLRGKCDKSDDNYYSRKTPKKASKLEYREEARGDLPQREGKLGHRYYKNHQNRTSEEVLRRKRKQNNLTYTPRNKGLKPYILYSDDTTSTDEDDCDDSDSSDQSSEAEAVTYDDDQYFKYSNVRRPRDEYKNRNKENEYVANQKNNQSINNTSSSSSDENILYVDNIKNNRKKKPKRKIRVILENKTKIKKPQERISTYDDAKTSNMQRGAELSVRLKQRKKPIHQPSAKKTKISPRKVDMGCDPINELTVIKVDKGVDPIYPIIEENNELGQGTILENIEIGRLSQEWVLTSDTSS